MKLGRSELCVGRLVGRLLARALGLSQLKRDAPTMFDPALAIAAVRGAIEDETAS